MDGVAPPTSGDPPSGTQPLRQPSPALCPLRRGLRVARHDIPTLDEMYYGFNEARPTRFQRELGFDLIGLPAPMRIVTNAYKT